MGWGDPDTIHDGGVKLTSASEKVGARANGLDSAGAKGASGSGNATLSAAFSRFGAASSQYCADLEKQLGAAAKLANAACDDLRHATGDGH